ncbi:hypothetical protein BH18THE2_BH18THE2_41660 [soil metagenome]
MGLNKVGHTTVLGVLMILSALTTTAAPQLDVIAQENGLPRLFAIGSSDTGAKEVPLKGIRQNGEVTRVSDYKIDFNNVIQIPNGQNLVLFPDSSAQGFTIIKAKLVNEQKQTTVLVPVSGQQNTFSLNGIPNGVYTLQAVGRLGNTEGGYETVIVLPVLTEETKKVVQNRINQILFVDIYVEIIFEDPGPSPCYFDPNLAECKPINGKCPPGSGFNDDEQCIPHGKCPSGYGRLDDDETGKCYKKSEIKTCPDGYITHKDDECPPETKPPLCKPCGGELCPDVCLPPEPELPVCDENTSPGELCRDEGDMPPPDDNLAYDPSCQATAEIGCLDEETEASEDEDQPPADDEQPEEEPSDDGSNGGDDSSEDGETSQEGSDEGTG